MEMKMDIPTVKSKVDQINLSDIEAGLKECSTNLDSKDQVETASYYLGLYLNKLNSNYSFPMPVFPLSILPIEKEALKKIGFEFAKMLVLSQRNLKRYQEDAALFYTSFQEISEKQWSAIQNDLIAEVSVYDSNFYPGAEEIEIDLPKEYQEIINTKHDEKNKGVIQLHETMKEAIEGDKISSRIKSVFRNIFKW
jgi:hypothetical protein